MTSLLQLVTLGALLTAIGAVRLMPVSIYHVDTPEKYKLLQNDSISGDYELVYVQAPAHPDVLSLPKHYPTSKWLGLYFIDGNDRVHLFSQSQALWAQLVTRPNATLSLPTTYKAYELLYGRNAAVNTEAIDYILTFTNAERLLIADQSNVAFELNKRIEQLEAFNRLYQLELSIHRDSYNAIDLTKFLEKLPELKIAIFRADGLTPEEFDAFVRMQKVPKGWKLNVSPKGISYMRNPV